jgi:hypothetical protein
LDPIVAAIDTALDSHKDQHVRAVLARLAAITEDESCAVAMVGHLNKTPSRDAYVRVANSVAFWNAARSVVLVTEDTDVSDDLRLVAQRKANWSRARPIERHRLEEIVLAGTADPDTGDPIATSRMVFVELASDVDGADLLAPRIGGEESGKERQALRFLLDELWQGDWRPSAELKKKAGDKGIAERTLKRAAQDIGVEHESGGFPRATSWRLPQSGRGQARNDGPTGPTGAIPHSSAQSDLAQLPVGPVGPAGIKPGPTSAWDMLIPGDPAYLDLLDRSLAAGHVTGREHRDRRRLHSIIRSTRLAA